MKICHFLSQRINYKRYRCTSKMESFFEGNDSAFIPYIEPMNVDEILKDEYFVKADELNQF